MHSSEEEEEERIALEADDISPGGAAGVDTASNEPAEETEVVADGAIERVAEPET